MSSFIDILNETTDFIFKLNDDKQPLNSIQNIGDHLDIGYKNIKKYIDNCDIEDAIKNTIIEKHLSSCSYMYLIYPRLFYKVFGIDNEKIIQQLCISGFFHFMAIKCLDDLIDSSSKSQKEQSKQDYFMTLITVSFYNEHAVKTWSSIFNEKKEVWQKRELKYKDFFKFSLDTIRQQVVINDFKDYEIFASEKSKISFVCLDALYSISNLPNRESIYNLCNQINQKLALILQIHDDIKDLDEDIENGQFNLLIYLAKKEQIKIDSKTIKESFYQSGRFTSLFKLILKSIEQIKSLIIKEKEFEHIVFFLQKNYNKTIKEILNIEGYNYYCQYIDLNKSSKLSKRNNPQMAYEKGVKYIFSRQVEKGNWFDFFNNAGLSDVWATAFILSTLNSQTINKMSKQVDLALKFLVNVINSDLGWGYNSSWITDTDSTTFVLLAHLNLNYTIDKKIIQSWVNNQQEDGGFTTYPNFDSLSISLGAYQQEKKIFQGWTQSHFCVSATAFYCLSKIKGYESEKTKLISYLVNCFNTGNSFSYWWTNSIYGINYIMKGLKHLYNNDLFFCVQKTINKEFIGKKNEEISDIIDNNIYLSQLIESLIILQSFKPKQKYATFLQQLKSILLDRQQKNGSWESSVSLRIPAPHLIDPRDEKIIWEHKSTGGNTLYQDFNRLFTSATCCESLELLLKHNI